LLSFVSSLQTFIPLILCRLVWAHTSFAHFLFAFLAFLPILLIPLLLIQSLNNLLLLGQLLLELRRPWLGVLELWRGELVFLALLFGQLPLIVGVLELLAFEVPELL
jgi:hypothetical protein